MNRYLTFWTGLKDALETHEEVETDRDAESGYAVVASATDRRAAVYEADVDDAKVLGHLPDGTLLEVVSTTGGWCRIRYKGHEGYMIGDDLMMEST